MTLLHYKGKHYDLSGYVTYKEENVIVFKLLTKMNKNVVFTFKNVQENIRGIKFVGYLRDYIIEAVVKETEVIHLDYILKGFSEINGDYNSVEVGIKREKLVVTPSKYILFKTEDNKEGLLKVAKDIIVRRVNTKITSTGYTRDLYITDILARGVYLQIHYKGVLEDINITQKRADSWHTKEELARHINIKYRG